MNKELLREDISTNVDFSQSYSPDNLKDTEFYQLAEKIYKEEYQKNIKDSVIKIFSEHLVPIFENLEKSSTYETMKELKKIGSLELGFRILVFKKTQQKKILSELFDSDNMSDVNGLVVLRINDYELVYKKKSLITDSYALKEIYSKTEGLTLFLGEDNAINNISLRKDNIGELLLEENTFGTSLSLKNKNKVGYIKYVKESLSEINEKTEFKEVEITPIRNDIIKMNINDENKIYQKENDMILFSSKFLDRETKYLSLHLNYNYDSLDRMSKVEKECLESVFGPFNGLNMSGRLIYNKDGVEDLDEKIIFYYETLELMQKT
tara:strand:+ start:14991 stop:15956 length:966 start_codon:yes stop_codon:yes gene_type:complete